MDLCGTKVITGGAGVENTVKTYTATSTGLPFGLNADGAGEYGPLASCVTLNAAAENFLKKGIPNALGVQSAPIDPKAYAKGNERAMMPVARCEISTNATTGVRTFQSATNTTFCLAGTTAVAGSRATITFTLETLTDWDALADDDVVVIGGVPCKKVSGIPGAGEFSNATGLASCLGNGLAAWDFTTTAPTATTLTAIEKATTNFIGDAAAKTALTTAGTNITGGSLTGPTTSGPPGVATQAAGNGSRPSIAGTECEGDKVTTVITDCEGGGSCAVDSGDAAGNLLDALNAGSGTDVGCEAGNGTWEGSRVFNYNTWACGTATARVWKRTAAASCP
jgi:hypothetical protein